LIFHAAIIFSSFNTKWFADFVSFLIYLTELSAGGVTSGWFCLESSVLTLAISYAAFSFYRDRTSQKARRMFHASLLYLPVFMSGLLLHRLPDNQQCVQEDNAERIAELSSSLGTLAEESEIRDDQKNTVMRSTAGKKARPPVAYASVAPFPFLPAPLYTAP
jgi:protoheme IX farnesyltransferase